MSQEGEFKMKKTNKNNKVKTPKKEPQKLHYLDWNFSLKDVKFFDK
jgi:hypothetical protein